MLTSTGEGSTSTPMASRPSCTNSGSASRITRVWGGGIAQADHELRGLRPLLAAAHDDRVVGARRPLQGGLAVGGDVDGQDHLLQHEHCGERCAVVVEGDERAAVSAEATAMADIAHAQPLVFP